MRSVGGSVEFAVKGGLIIKYNMTVMYLPAVNCLFDQTTKPKMHLIGTY